MNGTVFDTRYTQDDGMMCGAEVSTHARFIKQLGNEKMVEREKEQIKFNRVGTDT